jgi:hypothetical protein
MVSIGLEQLHRAPRVWRIGWLVRHGVENGRAEQACKWLQKSSKTVVGRKCAFAGEYRQEIKYTPNNYMTISLESCSKLDASGYAVGKHIKSDTSAASVALIPR